MAQHMRVDFQGGEFRCQFQPVEHPPERGRFHTKHPIRRPQPWRTQWPQEALVLLRERMLAGLRSFQAANQYTPLLPLDVGPAQIAQFGDAQAVVEGNPDRNGIPCAVAVLLRRLAKDQHFLPTQVLAWPPLFVGDALWPELCSIFGVCGCCLDPPKARRLPRPRQRLCSITTRKWNTHSCLTDRRYASPSRCAVSLAWGSAMSFVPNTTSSRYVSQTHQRSGLLVGLTMYRSCISQDVLRLCYLFCNKDG